MMWIRLFCWLIPICGILSSCDGYEARRSIVGTWDIPSDDVLKAETVTLWFRKYGNSDLLPTLSYTLTPDGTVAVERGRDRIVCCFGGIDRRFIDSTQKVRIGAKDEVEIRRMLARLRPQELSAEVPFSMPEDCSFIHDGATWSGVTFERGQEAGTFMFQAGCKGEGSERATRLLASVVSKLPPVRDSADFIRD